MTKTDLNEAFERTSFLYGANAHFIEGTSVDGRFDAVIAIFFLHHLSDPDLAAFPERLREWLATGGSFYSLDPSRRRLSGAVGRLLIPGLMKRYQTEDERELEPEATAALFHRAGFDARVGIYDFGSSPLAGLFPGWAVGYRVARVVDDVMLRIPLVRQIGSNFEVIARKP